MIYDFAWEEKLQWIWLKMEGVSEVTFYRILQSLKVSTQARNMLKFIEYGIKMQHHYAFCDKRM